MGIFIWNKKQGQAKLKKIPTFLRNKWKDIENYEYYAKNAERTERIKKMTNEEIKKSGKTPKEYRDIKLRSLLEKTKSLHRNNIK